MKIYFPFSVDGNKSDQLFKRTEPNKCFLPSKILFGFQWVSTYIGLDKTLGNRKPENY